MARLPVDVAARTRSPRWLVPAATAVVCIPLVIALVSFRRPLWTPVLDLAMTELRVRDVGGRHTPLIGLPGRIGTIERQGSHPGPLSFYALAPAYRFLGSSAWALQGAALLVHVVAIFTSLAIAARRSGVWLVVAVAGLLAALTAGYGGGTLTEPWNPYLPLLWWMVVLLATWSVVCGDVRLWPVLVLAGSFCAQTHVPYLGLTVGMGGLALVATVLGPVRDPARRRHALSWIAAAAVLGVALWLPPTVDQLRREPGNYSLLAEHFSNPPEEPKGIGDGVEVGLRYLDLAHLVRADVTSPGWLVTDADGNLPSSKRGAVLLVIWAVSAAAAIRGPRPQLAALHAVVGAGIVLMILAISRIFGVVWYYLTLWGWAIGLLTLLATMWTAAATVQDRWTDERRSVAVRRSTIALAVVGLAVVVRFAAAAPDSSHADAPVTRELAAVIDDAAEGIEAGVGAATGTDGRYLITWSDAFHIGSQGYGLLSELERRGFDVNLPESRRVPATRHRTIDPSEATARIHLATGSFVEEYEARPDAVELASVDPRSRVDLAEQAKLRGEVVADLQALGFGDLVARLDDNLFGAAIDERLPEELRVRMGRILELGGPLAVFVVPADTPAR